MRRTSRVEVTRTAARWNPRRLLSVGFVLILALPLVQTAFPLFRERPLTGAEQKPKRIKLSLKAWWNGSLAQSVEAWTNKKIGFRPSLIRLSNQMQVALGVESSMQNNDRVRICKEGWLVSQGYLTSYAAPSQVLTDEQVEEFVSALKELQDRLRARGTSMVFVISPSKAEAYPEFLPDDIVAQRKTYQGVSDLERLRKHLAGSGVVYFDTPRYFQARRAADPDVRLYAKTGIHWTYQTAFEVWQELLLLVNEEYGASWPIPEQIAVEYDAPRGTDDDIAKLLNLFYLPGEAERIPYPVVNSHALPPEARPNCLFAGTSFSRTLVDSMYLSESARECDYLFYTSLQYSLPELDKPVSAGTRVEMEKLALDGFASVDWKTTLLDKQIVFLEMLEINVDELLYGFHDAALEALPRYPATPRLATRPEE